MARRRRTAADRVEGWVGLVAIIALAWLGLFMVRHFGTEAWAGLGLFLFLGSGSMRHVAAEPSTTSVLFSATTLTGSAWLVMAGFH